MVGRAEDEDGAGAGAVGGAEGVAVVTAVVGDGEEAAATMYVLKRIIES